MSYKLNLEKNWEEEEDEEDEEEEEIDEEDNNKLAISPYNNKNYYNDCYSGISSLEKKGYNVNLAQSKIFHPDGRVEYQSKLNFTKDEPRKVVRRFTQTKTELKKDFDLINQTKTYKTGIIFKDTHYYNIQRVIPKDYYVNYERTVEEYNDGTINYGDWKRIN